MPILHWITLGVTSVAGAPARDTTRVDTRIQAMVSAGRHPTIRWPNLSDVKTVVEAAYRQTGWRPLWMESGRPTAAAKAMITAIGAVGTRGLVPTDFDADSLAAGAERLARTDPDPLDQARFDLSLTTAVVRLASTLHEGRLDPRTIIPGWRTGPSRLDLVAVVDTLRRGADPTGGFDRLEPQSHEYRRLKQWLARYRAIAQTQGPPLPSPGASLSPGGGYRAAAQLRLILLAVGDLAPGAIVPAAADTLYDEALAGAVRRFQRRHGLTDDGVVGRATLAELNLPFQQRVRQIELALERRRWWPDSARTPLIVVNVPAFRLTAMDPSRIPDSTIEMKIIAGVAKKDETPVFTAELGRIVFSPFWEVPTSIMRKEIRPKALRDPTYLEREGMDLLEGDQIVPPTSQNVSRIGSGVRVRQRPGPRNALGRVKFLLASGYAIHLHDTPTQRLFREARRDFSHGCVRISDPPALARFALRTLPGWTSQQIDAALAADTSITVELPNPISVAVVYEPVTLSGDEIEFRPDLYGRDRALERLLAMGYPYRKRI